MTRVRLLAVALVLAGACAANAEAAPRSFATPQEGFAALATAINNGDIGALETMLGPEGRDIVSSGDEVTDRSARAAFNAAYREKSAIERPDATHAVLAIGRDEWEFPIPLTQSGGAWHFDTAVGKQELLNRRIGRNEDAAIKASRAYVAGQREYAAQSGGRYAQRIVSSPGAHDGLYWPAEGGAAESPLGPLFAQASAIGYSVPDAREREAQGPSPYYGYLYHVLTRQGPSAKGGARDYIAGEEMRGGFALLATPATYGVSGVMTFIVNQDGTVFEKDLGPDTASRAAGTTAFDPDKGWRRAQ